ncbi:P2X purinoceptor 7-like [Trichosurus vulpecula]|uniref:P2X purinoceptor 7-like n=1 Tax=Trichosurus vulpecula TaxID=9337 RepID=UPI00186AEE07|nr:P2X purinoceptor 7-like [Trichosurus vulpecula]
MCSCCSWRDICKYETAKVIRVQSMTYGTIRWTLCMMVFLYVCLALVSDKLYQRKEPLISSVQTKVKGIAEVKNGNTKMKVLDTADYTFPLQGNSFFVMTNFISTEGQTQGLCPEYPTRRTLCSTDQGCKKGRKDPLSKGIQTGKCVQYNATQKTCEVSAWCPVESEREAPRPALLISAENFTVLIKNNIDFPGHNYTTRNILPGVNITCTFHKTRNPQCPIFRLGDIFQEVGENFSDVAVQGGIMGIEIYWHCNLDRWFHSCRPKYGFRRLDDRTTIESLYPGYNFRFARYYMEGNIEKRNLVKAFGIRFDILVFGTGGKFDFIQMVVYIGSTLSYFGLATVFIDFLIDTYSSACCRSHVYRCCPVCEPCGVNEYYYRKKCETIEEPKLTLKYVSFVDEPHIRMVDQKLLGKSLQDVEGEEVPRPRRDFTDLAKLSPPAHPDLSLSPVPPEEMQLLKEEPRSPSLTRPKWCRCGHCRPSQLPGSSKSLEELCCRRKGGPCITTSALFKELVLSRSTLRFILFYQDPLLEMDAEALNNQFRHCAYRCYIDWRFGSEDMAGFSILPSCCRWKIRDHFPKQDGKYTGFKNPSPYTYLEQQSP